MINGRNNAQYPFIQYVFAVDKELNRHRAHSLRSWEREQVQSCYDGEMSPEAAASFIAFMRPTQAELRDIRQKQARGRFNRAYKTTF